MDLLGIIYSIVAFIVAIGVLVTVHEYGHFWVARKMGVKVLRFPVGFGKPLWLRRAGPVIARRWTARGGARDRDSAQER